MIYLFQVPIQIQNFYIFSDNLFNKGVKFV